MAKTIAHLQQEVSYEPENCLTCGIVFWITTAFQRSKIRDKTSLFCPNGHQQHYVGESDADKAKRLKVELDAAQARADELWEQQQKLATANRKLRKRAKAGVCPCCNRTFKQLADHMATEHPEFK